MFCPVTQRPSSETKNARYRALLDPRSIVAYHGWWKGRGSRERMKVRVVTIEDAFLGPNVLT
jgi:hypothetical protein